MNISSFLKSLGFFIFFLAFTAANGQDSVIIRTTSVLNDVSRNPVGINMNYLMDGSFVKPAPAVSSAEALRNMGVRFLRFPGGEKSDNYLWSVSPWTKPDPRFARTGPCEWPSGDSRFAEGDFATVKPDMLDFDEFIAMSKSLGAEPLIVVPYDAMYKPVPTGCQGTVPTKEQLLKNAEEWVRYANITKRYGITYWMIGNESYNSDAVNGSATASQYRDDIIEFSRRMKAIDPSIKIIANGDKASWWSVVLPAASAYIDFLGISNYPVWNYTGGYEYYRNNAPDLTGPVKTAVNAINSYAPAGHRDRLKVISTEFGAMDWAKTWPDANDLGHALVAFEMLGDHLVNPHVEAAIFWNTRWVNNTTKTSDIFDAVHSDGSLQANGAALSLWGNHLLDKMVAATSTGDVKSYASYSKATGRLNVYLINRETSARSVYIKLSDYIPGSAAKRYVLKGSGPSDTNPVLSMEGQVNTSGNALNLSLPAVSVTVLTFGAPPAVTSVSTAKASGGLDIYPNPGRDKVTVVYNLPGREPATLQVFSIDGREIYSAPLPEEGNAVLNTGSWARGMYLVRLNRDRESFTRKLVLD